MILIYTESFLRWVNKKNGKWLLVRYKVNILKRMLRFCQINTKGSSFCLVPISIYNWHYLDSFYIDHLLLKLLQLLEHFKVSEPWTPSYSVHKVPNNAIPLKKPTDFSSMELEQELFKLFLSTRFQPRYVFCLVPLIFFFKCEGLCGCH